MRDGYYDMVHGAQVDLLPSLAKMDDNIAIVTRIIVPKGRRGHGYASKLMEKVLNDADEEGCMLVLAVESYDDGLTNEQLADWYERLGFKWMKANQLSLGMDAGDLEPDEAGLIMVRHPKE